MSHDSIRYLEKNGFKVQTANASPVIMAHLESYFLEPNRIGPRFLALPQDAMAELIARGEKALLDDMAGRHRKTGKLKSIKKVIEMPFVVGTDNTVEIKASNKKRMLELIDQPGTEHEHVVHVIPVMADKIPVTQHVTVSGGVYADGHTAGYYGLQAGKHAHGTKKPVAMLATTDDINGLLSQMTARIDDIRVVPTRDAKAMIAKARKALKN